MSGEFTVLGTFTMGATDDLYRLVDFLNRNLKNQQVIFGLSKATEKDKMIITLYRTE
ncbi:DUF4264 domain-containing protein [Alicyclobacillaceae bacterium I2511]|nr:DUF4264 domain-containing protein [Alicyclobacillaceae bacterium I2511]